MSRPVQVDRRFIKDYSKMNRIEKQHRARGFTLIELLVVIAIIAILAAILFPVFAQAKAAAKKAQAISNLKQTALATLMYNDSFDDSFGMGVPYVGGSIGWAWDRFVPFSSLLPATANASVADAVRTHINNAVQPYMKTVDLFHDPNGTLRSPLPAGVFTAANITAIPAGTQTATYTYNGLLQGQSSSAVTAPASLIMWWTGQGKRSLHGAYYASPQLICGTANAPCVYVPAKAGCGANGETSFYTTNASTLGWDVHNNMFVYAYVDGHAGARRCGVNTTGKTDPRTDPFAYYLGREVDRFRSGGARYWDLNYCHGYLFRPEIDFQNWDTPLIAP